ncbi:MAG TPA: PEP-CTERM sorting domain-containing protein [Chthoniobacteraceae bacterium]|jgi:hypothetical protein
MKIPISLNAPVLACGIASLIAPNASAVLVNITPTGFTHDVVYEAGATGNGNGTFTNESSALYERGLFPEGTANVGTGLPGNRTITSAVDNATTFALQPYTGLNALVVGEGNNLAKFGTWQFAPSQQLQYTKLSILALSAGGQSNFSMVVFFTDGTNTSNGIANFENSGRFARGTFDGQVLPDWFQNGGTSAGAAASGVGRVDSNNGQSNGGNGVNLQHYNFSLSGFTGKIVDRLEFESTGGNGNNRAFLAITGDAVAVPEPSTLGLLGLTTVGVASLRRRRA